MSTPSLTIPPATATHEVKNQAPPLYGYDAFRTDAALMEAMKAHGAGWAEDRLASLGALAGTEQAIRWGFEANENPPTLRTHDRFGHRLDEVDFHPAWHSLMTVAVERGLHASSWREAKEGAQVARAAGFFLWSQVEGGHLCPISMTHAVVPALRMQPELAKEWEPRFTSLEYDFGLRPTAQKKGAICGMAMTEKQGGSDVRANTTRAVAMGRGGPGEPHALTGHKWFCSAPMSDAFLVLAQAEKGLSCFLMPRVLPDGTKNRMRLMRLKDKLGNRSNASSEIELDGAVAWMVGEEGRGVPTIIEMVNFTRLDCIIGSAALMRQGLVQAIHHAHHRSVFGKKLIDQPLMQNVLADLALESEAATWMAMRVASSCEKVGSDEHEMLVKRLATAIGKYWVSKRAPMHAAETMECLGGNGYVEDSGMPRMYREAPVNSIWEGSGNVNSLDVLRAMSREPRVVEAYFAEIEKAAGGDARLDAGIARLQKELGDLDGIEARARRVVEQMAMLFQGSLLVRHAPAYVADVFCASRLSGDWGQAFGTLPKGVDAKAIVARAFTP